MTTLIWKAAREKARELRMERGTSDPYDLCRELGIEVVTAILPEGISGMIVKRRGEDATIFIHMLDAPVRRRFTCAHELGHFLERVDFANDDDFSFRDTRSEKYDLHEFFADEFAGELLMPAEQILADRNAGMAPSAMAGKYRVSVTAVNKRLSRLDKTPPT